MKSVTEFINSDYFRKSDSERLGQIYSDSKEIISDFRKILKEDERRPLKGKVDEFKRKYKEIYYHAHNMIVGKDVDWQTLSDIENSDSVAEA